MLLLFSPYYPEFLCNNDYLIGKNAIKNALTEGKISFSLAMKCLETIKKLKRNSFLGIMTDNFDFINSSTTLSFLHSMLDLSLNEVNVHYLDCTNVISITPFPSS